MCSMSKKWRQKRHCSIVKIKHLLTLSQYTHLTLWWDFTLICLFVVFPREGGKPLELCCHGQQFLLWSSKAIWSKASGQTYDSRASTDQCLQERATSSRTGKQRPPHGAKTGRGSCCQLDASGKREYQVDILWLISWNWRLYSLFSRITHVEKSCMGVGLLRSPCMHNMSQRAWVTLLFVLMCWTTVWCIFW